MKTNDVFTDADLKRLKTMVLNCEATLPIRLSNLLIRLEAAEAYIKTVEEPEIHGAWSAYRDWKKAAGK